LKQVLAKDTSSPLGYMKIGYNKTLELQFCWEEGTL